MAVQVADTLTQKNGLNFPIVDGNAVKGGYHTVATIEARDALIGGPMAAEGMLVYVEADGIVYKLKGDTYDVFGSLTEADREAILKYIEDNYKSHNIQTDEAGVDYILLP